MNRLKKKLYIETFGCQMNYSDSEIVVSVLKNYDYVLHHDASSADVIFLNTCSIRENAEDRVLKRIGELKHLKRRNRGLIIGILGCMAERMKERLFSREPAIDILAGPDAYRDLPRLIYNVRQSGNQIANLILSAEETYADINPVRLQSNGVSAFISIMRGCQNFCSYCVVPYTRGKERSRNPESIINECIGLYEKAYREITLLGQNVNSYYAEQKARKYNFPVLLSELASISPNLRLRFATSHPKDLSDELILRIAENKNICRSIHLPVQSGSNSVLERMNRNYSREWYLDRIEKIRSLIPDCAISTDIISGFCGETEADHQQTLSMMREAAFDYAFMFKYSEREGTGAAEKYADDVPDETKLRRLNEVIALQQELSHNSNKADVGKTFEVLTEGFSKRSNNEMMGRNSQNKVVVFSSKDTKAGEYTNVKITSCTSATLKGKEQK